MEAEKNLQQMASASLAIIGQRRALVFTASVKAAEMTAEIFNRHRKDMAAWVCGKTDREERRTVLADFAAGRTRLLVATTVIEVGVDVAEASVMVIEHAERFGLAQLHQLRGRVGRGAGRSSCLLLYKGPLGEAARARL